MLLIAGLGDLVLIYLQACLWKWDSHRNPMGNAPWDGMGQHALHFP